MSDDKTQAGPLWNDPDANPLADVLEVADTLPEQERKLLLSELLPSLVEGSDEIQ